MLFEALREKLLIGGIAPRHVRRYLGELEDHLVELTRCEEDAGYAPAEAAIRARTALGPDEELADAMLKQRDFRSISARFPWLVFGLLPLLTMILASLIPTLGLILLMNSQGVLGKHPLPPPDWLAQVMAGIVHASNLLVNPLVACLFVAIAWRQRLNPIWPLIGIAVVLLLFLHMEAGMPHIDPHPDSGFGLGVRYVPRSGYRPGSVSLGMNPIFQAKALYMLAMQWPWVMAQYLLTLLPVAWLIVAQRRRRTSCEN